MSPQFFLVGKLLILLGVGFVLRKKDIIPEEGKKLLTDLISVNDAAAENMG